MALRWRKDGPLLCAAKCKARKDDTYINDRLHYQLSVELKAIVPDVKEEKTGLWFWAKDVFPVVDMSKYNRAQGL